MNNATIELPTIVESYAFWSLWFEKHTERVKGLVFRTAKRQDLLDINKNECPFCYGAEYVPFTEVYTTGVYVSQHVLCACKILEIAGKKSELESYWSPRKLSEIETLAKPNKDAAQYTKFIKTTTATFLKELGDWIYLQGPYGCGKTHILQAVKTQLRGLALYVNTSELVGHIYEATAKKTLGELIDDISAAPVLLLDDFGVEHGTEFLYSALYTIINKRYAKRHLAPTFITSNLTQEELHSSTNDNMRRIASRIGDTKLVIPLVSTQVDYRSLA